MRNWIKRIGALTLCCSSAFSFAEGDYSLMLIGGGLEFCSSLTPRECSTPLAAQNTDVSTNFYQLSESNVAALSQLSWLQEREVLKSNLIALADSVSKQVSGKLTRRQLFNHLRNHEVMIGERIVRGGNISSQLHREELAAFLDVLQVGHFESGLLGQGARLKPLIDLNNSKSRSSQLLLQQFVKLAAKNKPLKNTHILLVTSAQRDPYVQVDVYSQIFEQLGVKVSWLPIDMAYFQTLDQMERSESESCNLLAENQARYLNLYGRGVVYPDLYQRQIEFCEKPKKLKEMLAAADGIYFVHGDPHRLRDTFVGSTEQASKTLTEIKSKMLTNQIIVAADDGAARALVGNLNAQVSSAMLMEGSSHGALSSPSFHSFSPLKGCHKYQQCPKNYQDGSLTYHKGGGLGLFPYGTVDTRLSELARQGRLVKAIAETNGSTGYGLDERTALLVSSKSNEAIAVKMEVIGENGLYVFDSSEIERDSEFSNAILSVKNHYLTPGDRILFRHGKFVISFADWKYSKNQVAKPLITSGGAFKRDNYRRATKMLCSTGAKDATLKHKVVGKGHKIFITKSRNSISLAGLQKIRGKQQSFCSYRDYYLDITKI